jgi:hypothetical protein
MGLLADLASGGVEGLMKGVGGLAKDVRAAITGKSVLDPQVQAEVDLKLAIIEDAGNARIIDLAIKEAQGQVDINKIEATSPSLWNRWRSAAGWTCVLSLFYSTFGRAVIPWLVETTARLCGYQAALPTLPEVDVTQTVLLLGGMLGLGGLRTVERLKEVASR